MNHIQQAQEKDRNTKGETENKEILFIKGCWHTGCKKIATCIDNCGWEWCDTHLNYGKEEGILQQKSKDYDADYYRNVIKDLIAQTIKDTEERIVGEIKVSIEYLEKLEKLGCGGDWAKHHIKAFEEIINLINK